MNVLVADKLTPFALDAMAALGLSVHNHPELTADGLAHAAADAHVLVVRSTKVNGACLEASKNLELVVRAGAGVNTIDVAAASNLGIFVANCPGKNAVAVAELALGLMFALDRRIPQADRSIKDQRWEKSAFGKAEGLFGKTIGIVGMGQIGCEIAQRGKALGLRVVGWSPSFNAARAQQLGIQHASSLEELAAQAEVLSVNVAFNEQTKHLISADILERLPQRAMIVNTSRGGVVDESALLQVIDRRELRYGADVFADEPGSGESFHNELALHPNVIATPHIGASTQQAQAAVAEETVRIVESFVTTGFVPNCVNLCKHSPAGHMLIVRHLDRVGVLAGVLSALRESDINVEEMQNVVFDGAQAACARLQLAGFPSDALLDNITKQDNILSVRLVQTNPRSNIG